MVVAENVMELENVQAAGVLEQILMKKNLNVQHAKDPGNVLGVLKQRRLLKIAFFLDLYQTLLYKGIYEWR